MNAKGVSIALLAAALASPGFAQAADPIEELKACARMSDQDARHACFDQLGERVLREEPTVKKSTREAASRPETAATAPAATKTGPKPMPDDLGQTKTVDKLIRYSGTVKACKEGQYGDWYFFFENGQVWKEISDQRLRFKDCHFDVTITEDFFGYKMSIEELDKSFAVRRHQ